MNVQTRDLKEAGELCLSKQRNADPQSLPRPLSPSALKKLLYNRAFNKFWRKTHKKEENERSRNYAKTSKAKKYKREWCRKNVAIERARAASNRALMSGKIRRKTTCEVCKKRKSKEMHHKDYSKPLDVLFVCLYCHRVIHKRRLP